MFQAELERVRQAGWPEGSYGIYFLDETSDFEALAKAVDKTDLEQKLKVAGYTL